MSDTSGSISKLDANQVLRLSYDEQNNRLRVAATVVASIGDIDVHIDAADGDNIAIADPTGTNFLLPNADGSINTNVSLNASDDSVAISDGVNTLDINPNGSINVVITASGLTTHNVFNEVDNVISGITTAAATYTALANTKLLSCDFGGTNMAMYSLYIGATLSAKKYTFYQNLNERFDFKDGLPVQVGDIIKVEVVHFRPDPGNFNVNILLQD